MIVQLVPSLRDEHGRVLDPATVSAILGGMAIMFGTGLLAGA